MLFADESTFTTEKVPTLVWAFGGIPARVVGNTDKGGISLFMFMNASEEITHVTGEIGKTNY